VGETREAVMGTEQAQGYKQQLRGYQTQLADMIDERAKQVSSLVQERGHLVAEQIRSITFLEEGPTDQVMSTPAPQVIGGRDDLAM